MNDISFHGRTAWPDHAAPAAVVVTLCVMMWQPGPVVSVDGEPRKAAEGRIQELAALLGDPIPRSAEIQRVLRSFSPFPPNVEACRALAEVFAKCGMSDLATPQRAELARQLYAITTGGDVSGERLDLALTEIQQTVIRARCAPDVVAAITDSARRAARIEPNPRRDWW